MKNRPLPALPQTPQIASKPKPPLPSKAKPSLPAYPAVKRPPPPPQMVTTNSPIPPPPQPMRLDATAQENKSTDTRSTFLDEIHGGKILKKVPEKTTPVIKFINDSNAMAKALQEALKKREDAMHPPSDEETCENSSGDDDEWDD
jgi:hypothetical protein